MYAQIIEREAKRIFFRSKIENEDASFYKNIQNLTIKMRDKNEILGRTKTPHAKGYVLSIILENVYQNFHERKKWIQSLLSSR